MNRPLSDQALQLSLGIRDGTLRPIQVVLKYLAQSRAVRHQHRFCASRKLFLYFKQSFEDELAGQVDVHRVVEHNRNKRETDFREGTHLRERRHTSELQLDRIGHQPLDFGR